MKNIILHIIFLFVTFTISNNTNCQCISGDCVNGNGKKLYSKGDSYEGEFKNGRENGYGKTIHSDGSTFEGEYNNGQTNGRGVVTHKDNYQLAGNWINNMQVGYAFIKLPSGEILEGTIKDNQLNTKTVIITDENREKYNFQAYLNLIKTQNQNQTTDFQSNNKIELSKNNFNTELELDGKYKSDFSLAIRMKISYDNLLYDKLSSSYSIIYFKNDGRVSQWSGSDNEGYKRILSGKYEKINSNRVKVTWYEGGVNFYELKFNSDKTMVVEIYEYTIHENFHIINN
jgi:hypothetical protein